MIAVLRSIALTSILSAAFVHYFPGGQQIQCWQMALSADQLEDMSCSSTLKHGCTAHLNA